MPNAFAAHFQAHDHHEHEHADPKGEVDEKRCHGGAEGVQRIKLRGLYPRRGEHELLDGSGIHAVFPEDALKGPGGLKGAYVGLQIRKVRGNIGEKRLGALQGRPVKGEGLLQLAEHRAHLVHDHLLARYGRSEAGGRRRESGEPLAQAGDRFGAELPAVFIAAIQAVGNQFVHGVRGVFRSGQLRLKALDGGLPVAGGRGYGLQGLQRLVDRSPHAAGCLIQVARDAAQVR